MGHDLLSQSVFVNSGREKGNFFFPKTCRNFLRETKFWSHLFSFYYLMLESLFFVFFLPKRERKNFEKKFFQHGKENEHIKVSQCSYFRLCKGKYSSFLFFF